MTATILARMADKRKKKPGPAPQPGSKRSQGVDRHADPRFTFHMERELLAGLDAYLASLPHDPGRSQVMRDALRDFLRSKGFFPPPSPPPK